MSVASPRRSIREALFQIVLAYQQQEEERKHKRSLTWGGPANAGGINDDDEPGFWEEEEGTMELVQLGAERTKNVLILMSDTGGGHRASAEAIRDAFRIEFGDEYRVGVSFHVQRCRLSCISPTVSRSPFFDLVNGFRGSVFLLFLFGNLCFLWDFDSTTKEGILTFGVLGTLKCFLFYS